jgi:hypothetical protein
MGPWLINYGLGGEKGPLFLSGETEDDPATFGRKIIE